MFSINLVYYCVAYGPYGPLINFTGSGVGLNQRVMGDFLDSQFCFPACLAYNPLFDHGFL